jgi:signal transduction histidine kinase
MAGTLSACPRSESALSGADAATGGISRLPLIGFNIVRLLQGAVLLHASALAYALFHPISLPSLAIIVTGLIVTLVALRLPQLLAPPAAVALAQARHVPPTADLSPAQVGSGASPSPLPFMGERIALDPEAVQLTRLARAAARLNRMPNLHAHPWGDLIARVSHELRTPLNAVIGFSDVMHAELLGPVGHPRYREYARHIRDCGRDLLKSAEDTLAITCLLDHDPNAAMEIAVDFRAMVDEAWAFYADPLNAGGIALEAEVPEGLEVLVDRRPLRQILINLFAEAVRRTDARGTVGLVATVDGDLVQIEVYLRGRPGDVSVGQASLPICLARALLELHGAALIEVDDPFSTWRAVTVLRCSTQGQFFTFPQTYARPQAQLC